MVCLAKKWQIDNNISGVIFSNHCGISQQTLSNIYAGKTLPGDDFLEALGLGMIKIEVEKQKIVTYYKKNQR